MCARTTLATSLPGDSKYVLQFCVSTSSRFTLDDDFLCLYNINVIANSILEARRRATVADPSASRTIRLYVS